MVEVRWRSCFDHRIYGPDYSYRPAALGFEAAGTNARFI
jgi:hypothetical protein